MAKHSAMFDPTSDPGDVYGYEESSFSIPKALSLFFGVVLMAGIFFGGGYHMGHSAGLTQAVATATSLGPPAPTYSSKEKPAAALEVTPQASDPAVSPEPIVTENAAAVAPAVKESSTKSEKAAVAQTGSFTVQVAAVRHEEDAEALLSALRKKQYPVFLASANSDSLFHVQVGPFPNQKEADGMRTRLASDGYNAIVKK